MPKINISNLNTTEVLTRLTKFAESKTVKPDFFDPEPLDLPTIRRLSAAIVFENHGGSIPIERIAGIEVSLAMKITHDNVQNTNHVELDTTKFDEKYGEDSAKKVIDELRPNGSAFFSIGTPQPNVTPEYTMPLSLAPNAGFSKSARST